MDIVPPVSSGLASLAMPESSTNTEKALKRKFEEAMQNLDAAVGPSTLDIPPSTKRPKVSRSLYSTLAKYGIKKDVKSNASSVSRMDSIAKSAPHLVAILSRSVSRSRKPAPFKPGHPPLSSTQSSVSAGSDYRPSSTAAFISRLATFKLTTYANKPSAIDAVAAARCGWINEGKDRLMCGICAASWVVAGTNGMNRDAANALVEKQRIYLVEMHKDGCPWKSRQCDPSIYHVPLQMPAAMIRELKGRAMKLHLVMKDVQIKHPLTTTQMQQFSSVMRSAKLHNLPAPSASSSAPSDAEGILLVDEALEQELSENAMLTALFGWSTVLPTASEHHPGPSASRATSVAPSLPSTPVRPRLPLATPRRSTPALSTPRTPLSSRLASSPRSSNGPAKVKADTTLLFCSLCQRRVGLWAFLPNLHAEGVPTPLPSGPSLAGENQTQPRRQLDVLKEHRSYCPYVVRSTVVPTLPVSPLAHAVAPSRPSISSSNSSSTQLNVQPGAIEGWRAVMTVVLRHGLAQKHRLARSRSHRTLEEHAGGTRDVEMEWADAAGEISQAEAMVEGVKMRGGKDLLKYVKGLLG